MATFNRVALAAVAGLALAAALSAQETPESLLPPGFSQPAPPPADQPAPRQSQVPITAPSGTRPSPTPAASASPTPGPTIDAAMLARYELPDYARRSLARVGATGAEGLPPDAFGRADGRFLETLMRRIDAPVASRWLSIALRRTLVSAVDTPANVNGADFAAERAWLLVRMGEAVAARAVVQGVDPDQATPKLMQLAMQAALATGDPAAMCPFADKGLSKTGERGWALARAMCFGMAGEPAQAGAAVSAARRRGLARGIDLALAEKVVGAGAQGRRAVTIEWPGVDRLSAWRFGLAAATGVAIPDDLFATAGPQVRYWHALAPIYPAVARAGDAELAAGQGILSNLALVDLYGAIDDDEDSASAGSGIARDLRTAYVAGTAAERLTALKGLWGEPRAGNARYGRLVLTARAAARIRPSDAPEDADALIASILTAGLDRNAQRWAGQVANGSDGWAMLLLSDPAGRALAYGDADDFKGGGHKAQLFMAALAGLGRFSPEDMTRAADGYDLDLSRTDVWTRAIDTAARANQPGTVILLCAAGMQTGDWRGVRPDVLYRMLAALRATGLDGYARMMAAEAVARL
ncbi:MAG: hypothetical protein V4659_00735 [Pseudomonadota bacterium]